MELRDYINVIRARKWIIVEAVAIVTLSALLFSLLQTPLYQGQVTVLVGSTNQGAAILSQSVSDFLLQPERGLQTEAQIIQLPPFAADVIKELGLKTTPDELLKRVTVTTGNQTNLVTIVVQDPSPVRAAQIANALAEAYVTWSRETRRESILSAAAEVQSRLDDAKAQILDLGNKIQKAGKTEDLASELQIATDLYSTLAQKLEDLRVSAQLEAGAGRIVSVAVVDPKAVEPQKVRNVALGFALGLVLGLALAFLLEYLDNTIRSSEEVEAIYGAPILGDIPLQKLQEPGKRQLTVVDHPESFVSESYRLLRNSLDFVNFQNDIKVLLVTSAAPAEGKSTVAANLAATLAQSGKTVVLVNCDFRRPATEHFFAVNETLGLSDVLAGAFTLQSALQESGIPGLWVLTAGKLPPNPSALLGSKAMVDVIAALRQTSDWVIVDSPPVMAVAEPGVIARWADGILIVSRAGSSVRDAARKTRELLENVGGKIVGVVEWGLIYGGRAAPTGGHRSYYGKYYNSYYSAYASEDGKKKRGKGSAPVESAEGTVAPLPASDLPLPKPLGRRIADLIGGIMLGLASFVAVLLVAALLAWGLDWVFHWGLVVHLSSLWH